MINRSTDELEIRVKKCQKRVESQSLLYICCLKGTDKIIFNKTLQIFYFVYLLVMLVKKTHFSEMFFACCFSLCKEEISQF